MSYVESVAIVSRREVITTDGGDATSGAKRQITLNNLDSDNDSIIVGLTGSGNVELVNGQYRIRVLFVPRYVGFVEMYLYDIDNTTYYQSTPCVPSGTGTSTWSFSTWLVDAGGANGNNFSFHFECSRSQAGYGLGSSADFDEECFTYVIIEKMSVVDQGLSEALVVHAVASGATSGSFSSGARRTAPLDTKVFDPDGIVGTITANALPLGAGTYFALGCIETTRTGRVQAYIENDTDGTTIEKGLSYDIGSTSATYVDGKCFVCCVFTLGLAKTISLQGECSASRTPDGWGFDDGGFATGSHQASFLYIRKLS